MLTGLQQNDAVNPSNQMDSEIRVTFEDGKETWEIPAGANTKYLSHGYFRYIGQFPPQIARAFVHRYGRHGQTLLDPMCGGGTALLEARIHGLSAIGFDINPVAVMWSRVKATHYDPLKLNPLVDDLMHRVRTATKDGLDHYLSKSTTRIRMRGIDLRGNEKFFDKQTLEKLGAVLALVNEVPMPFREFVLAGLLAIARKVSLANKKKMNVVLDNSSHKYELTSSYAKQLTQMVKINEDLGKVIKSGTTLEVSQRDARSLDLDDGEIDVAMVHPPYPTNTAFSESLRLQLSILGIDHRSLSQDEIQVRGSYFHKPDGVRRYLVDWHKVLSEMHRVLKRQGHCCVVIGDGRMDFVRIPMGAITREFARDLGFSVDKFCRHILVNNTGRTLDRRMTIDYVIILRKD